MVSSGSHDWRSGLREKILWLLLAKLVGLLLLWWFFFSPAHRVHVTPERATHAFALGERPHD